jgi:tryptophan-rich sensory protein
VTPRRSTVTLILAVLLCLAAGALGSLATASSVGTWYRQIEKPEWTPPSAVFGPVWTVLYVTMGVALWMVWRDGRGPRWRVAVAVFAAQLSINVAWSFLFFGLRSPGWALIDIVLLWLAIVATIVTFFRIRAAAGGLLVPYLLWVTYAGALNLAIWRMNP